MKAFTEERTIRAIDGDHAHARPPARARPPRRGGLPRRGRQPEPQRRGRVGRPGHGVARPHDVPPRLGRLDPLRRVPPPGQGGGQGQVQPPLPPGRRHDARQLGRRGVDLGQRQPLDHDPRDELPGRPRLRRLPVGRPRVLPRGRHRGRQRPRPQPGRPGVRRQARSPSQILPFDNNGGAGFWWANSRNTFTRNVAVECDRYGFRFEATPVNDAETGPERARRTRTRPRLRPPPARPAARRRRGRPSTSARCRSSGSRTTRRTASSTGSTWARASAGSAPTRGTRSSCGTRGSGTTSGRSGPARPRSWSTAWTSTTGDTGSTGRSTTTTPTPG